MLTMLEEAVRAWKARASLIMSLANEFAGREQFRFELDSSKMSAIDIAFRTPAKSHIISVLLYVGEFAGGGRILHKTETSDGQYDERKLNEFTAEDVSKHDICVVVLSIINTINGVAKV